MRVGSVEYRQVSAARPRGVVDAHPSRAGLVSIGVDGAQHFLVVEQPRPGHRRANPAVHQTRLGKAAGRTAGWGLAQGLPPPAQGHVPVAQGAQLGDEAVQLVVPVEEAPALQAAEAAAELAFAREASVVAGVYACSDGPWVTRGAGVGITRARVDAPAAAGICRLGRAQVPRLEGIKAALAERASSDPPRRTRNGYRDPGPGSRGPGRQGAGDRGGLRAENPRIGRGGDKRLAPSRGLSNLGLYPPIAVTQGDVNRCNS